MKLGKRLSLKALLGLVLTGTLVAWGGVPANAAPKRMMLTGQGEADSSELTDVSVLLSFVSLSPEIPSFDITGAQDAGVPLDVAAGFASAFVGAGGSVPGFSGPMNSAVAAVVKETASNQACHSEGVQAMSGFVWSTFECGEALISALQLVGVDSLEATAAMLATGAHTDGPSAAESDLSTALAAPNVRAGSSLACDDFFCTVMVDSVVTATVADTGSGATPVFCAAVLLAVPNPYAKYAAAGCAALGIIIWIQAVYARNNGQCLGLRFTPEFKFPHTVVENCA